MICSNDSDDSEAYDPSPMKRIKGDDVSYASDSSSESSETADDEAFDEVVDELRPRYTDKCVDLIEDYMTSGMSDNKAEKTARKLLKPKIDSKLVKIYKTFLLRLHLMKRSPLHKDIWNAVLHYKNEDKSINRAIALAVKEYKEKLMEVLERTNDIGLAEEEDSDIDDEDENEEDSEAEEEEQEQGVEGEEKMCPEDVELLRQDRLRRGCRSLGGY